MTIRAEAGPERDLFVKRIGSVLTELELQPEISFSAPPEEGSSPQLIINNQVIVAGLLDRSEVRAAVDRSLSGW